MNLISPNYRGIPAQLQSAFNAALNYLSAQLAPSTLRAYRSDFAVFVRWCERHGLDTKPAQPDTLVLFLAEQAQSGLAAITLERRLASINYVHRLHALPSPTDDARVRAALSGIRRIHGTAPRRQKTPLLDAQIIKMMAHCPATLRGLRDQTILALGFAGAFRRSELASLRLEQLKFSGDDVICTLPRSKTDQDGKGMDKPILNGARLQPVSKLKAWLKRAGIDDGYVFRRVDWGDAALEAPLSSAWIARVVQHYAAAIGLDPKQLGAHSLRSGFITSCGEHEVTLYKIMEVTGQKDPRTVLRYLRRPNLFKNHAGAGFLYKYDLLHFYFNA